MYIGAVLRGCVLYMDSLNYHTAEANPDADHNPDRD